MDSTFRKHALAAAVLMAAAAASHAQTQATGDSRTVRQPLAPPVCMTLTAQFSSSQRATPPDPSVDDTARLQAALNSCAGTGKTVALAASGSNDSFYSGALTANGVGLAIRAGTTLFGNAYTAAKQFLLFTGTNASLMGPGTVDGRGDLLTANKNRLVQGTNITNFVVYNVTLKQAIYPNLYVEGGNGLTVWGVTIRTPANRANADGIDVDSLSNATITNSNIEAGDDGVAIKTNSGNVTNITVSNNHLYGTHGLSVGSIYANTASNILFLNNYVDSMDLSTGGGTGTYTSDSNGARIKTGNCALNVQQVSFVNTCVINSKHLILFDTQYASCPAGSTAGTPSFQNIVVNGFYSTASQSGSYTTLRGQSAQPIGIYLANVNVDMTKQTNDQYATVGLSNSNDVPSGTGVTTSNVSIPGSVPNCTFVRPAN